MTNLEWFDVSNYDCCSDWTSKEWYYAITWRNLLSSVANDSPEDQDYFLASQVDDVDDAYNKKYTDQERAMLWREAIVTLHESRRAPYNKTYFAEPNNARSYRFVEACRMSYLGAVANEFIIERPENERQILLGNTYDADLSAAIGDISVDEVTKKKYPSPESWNHEILVTIDLLAPDAVLVKQMLELVQGKRLRYKIDALPRVPDAAKLAKWHKAKILGYFDICLYRKTQGVALTDQQIGIALYPGDYAVSLDDRIRKVTKPLASAVFKEATLVALQSLDSEWFQHSANNDDSIAQ